MRVFAVTAMVIGLGWPFLTSGQTVIASIDMGYTPLPSLEGYLLPGYDFYDSDDDPLDDSQNKHGTVQTQIIASKATTEEVNIIPLKITGPNKQSSGKIVNAAVKYATGLSETRVIVKSAGTQCRSKTYMRISNAGKVFILPAGNHSSTKPVSEANVVSQMEGRGVVVGALDENNKIAPYSNRAGSLLDFYIMAPGFNSFTSVKGTSFATSHVAALAAQILARAPELSAEEVVDIIFRSAKDAGAPGADDVYGRGIIDPSAALGPLGEIVLIDDPTESEDPTETEDPTESEDPTETEDPTESGGSAGAGALIVGGAVALAILQGGDLLNKAIVVDEYNRVFTANILKKISYRGMFNNAEKAFLEMFDWFANRDEKESNHLKSGLNNFSIESIGLIPGPSYSLGINRIPYGFFNEHRENNISLRLGNPNDYLRDQIMGFDDHGIFGSYNTIDAFGTKWSLMGSKVVPEGKYGLDSYSLKIKRKREGERLNVGISLGTLNEVGNLLGGSSGGALSVEESSTLSIGIEADYHIHKNYILRGSYINGFTFVEPTKKSIVNSSSLLMSDSFLIEGIFNNLIDKKDRLTLSISQPLNAYSGNLNLKVPNRVKAKGEILYSEGAINFGRNNASYNYNLMYVSKLNDYSDFGVRVNIFDLKLNKNLSDNNGLLSMVYSLRF